MIMKSRVIIIVLIIIIIAVVTFFLFMNRNKNTGYDGGYSSNNGTQVTYKNWGEDYNPNYPAGYTIIDGKDIKNDTDVVCEGIAYNYDPDVDTTYVNVHIQNRGTAPLDNNAECTISFYAANDREDNPSFSFGGILSDAVDLPVGNRSVITTQMIGKAENIVSAKFTYVIPERNVAEDVQNETSGE